MITLSSAAPTGSPTFISQYGPLIAALIAALIALLGVSLTLIVNGKRDRLRYRYEREDDYRREQRLAIAAVISAAHDCFRECTPLIQPYPRAEQLDAADAAGTALLSKFNVARLLIMDSVLQGALYGLRDAWNAVEATVDKMGLFVNQGQAERPGTEALSEELIKFDAAVTTLVTAAQEVLKPTVALEE